MKNWFSWIHNIKSQRTFKYGEVCIFQLGRQYFWHGGRKQTAFDWDDTLLERCSGARALAVELHSQGSE